MVFFVLCFYRSGEFWVECACRVLFVIVLFKYLCVWGLDICLFGFDF